MDLPDVDSVPVVVGVTDEDSVPVVVGVMDEEGDGVKVVEGVEVAVTDSVDEDVPVDDGVADVLSHVTLVAFGTSRSR